MENTKEVMVLGDFMKRCNLFSTEKDRRMMLPSKMIEFIKYAIVLLSYSIVAFLIYIGCRMTYLIASAIADETYDDRWIERIAIYLIAAATTYVVLLILGIGTMKISDRAVKRLGMSYMRNYLTEWFVYINGQPECGKGYYSLYNLLVVLYQWVSRDMPSDSDVIVTLSTLIIDVEKKMKGYGKHMSHPLSDVILKEKVTLKDRRETE